MHRKMNLFHKTGAQELCGQLLTHFFACSLLKSEICPPTFDATGMLFSSLSTSSSVATDAPELGSNRCAGASQYVKVHYNWKLILLHLSVTQKQSLSGTIIVMKRLSLMKPDGPGDMPTGCHGKDKQSSMLK